MSALRRVAVVIPSTGSRPYLPETVRCVHAQGDVDATPIVVADGPEAGERCRALLRSGPAAELIFLPKAQGGNSARNAGLRHADADFYFFLDDDDPVHPDLLSKSTKALEEDSADLAVSSCVTVGPDASSPLDALYRPPQEGHLARFLRHDVAWLSCACVYRRDCPGLQEGWKEGLPKHQDFHMHTQCLLAGAKVAVVPDILSFWRQHTLQRVSAAPAPVAVRAFFEILEDFRARLQTSPMRSPEAERALAKGYLKAMPDMVHAGERELCKAALARARGLVSGSRTRLGLYLAACLVRPTMAWRVLAGTEISPFEGLASRELTAEDRKLAEMRLAETRTAIEESAVA